MTGHPLVSVAVVTHGRPAFLPLLLAQFDAQTYGPRQLVVLDDSSAPCPALLELERPDLRYLHTPTRRTVGAKRNAILEHLDGELVCQWDDDDYYAPRYLEFMAGQLERVDFAKLDRWYVYDLAAESLAYWDTRQPPAGPPLPPAERDEWIDRNRLGYGFCFAYRREVLERVRSPDTSVGDDYAFARGVVDAGFRTALLPDREGLVLHVVHGGNLSRSFPNRPLPATFTSTIFPGFDAAQLRRAADYSPPP